MRINRSITQENSPTHNPTANITVTSDFSIIENIIDGKPASDIKSYTNFLPSLNLAADITDDLLRFAAGSTVSPPDFDDMQMASAIQVDAAQTAFTMTTTKLMPPLSGMRQATWISLWKG